MTIHLRKPAIILTDIEGTTTSVRFWNDVLAPFVLHSMADCFAEWWDQEYCSDVVQVIRNRTEKDWFEGDHRIPVIAGELEPKEKIIASLVTNGHFLMVNKHNEAVKSLTLLVWLYGYEKGLLKGKQTPLMNSLSDVSFFKDTFTKMWLQLSKPGNMRRLTYVHLHQAHRCHKNYFFAKLFMETYDNLLRHFLTLIIWDVKVTRQVIESWQRR